MRKWMIWLLCAVMILSSCNRNSGSDDPTKATETTVADSTEASVESEESSNGVDESTEGTDDVDSTAPSGEETTGDFIDMDQAAITEAMGAGWNLGNQLEAVNNRMPGETNWGNPVITEELLQLVKQAGFQSVRIPVSYFNKIGDAPDYKVDEAWLARVAEVVDYCVDNDLYAVINMHGDGYTTIDGGWLLCAASNQDEICEKYEAVWKQIAEYFKDYDEHLIFESMNEEFDGSYSTPNKTYYANINRYNQIFVDCVRQTGGNNAKRWLIVPGWNTDINYTVGNYGFEIPEDTYRSSEIPENEKRIMISVHYYSPWDFCGTESGAVTQWGNETADHSKEASYDNEAAMVSKFQQLHDKFVSQGYPVFIGEYGAIDKTMDDPDNAFYRAYFCERLCQLSQQYGCIPMYWDNGVNSKYGFGIFDRKAVKVTQQSIIDAMVGVYHPEALQGNAESVSLDQTALQLQAGTSAVLTATMTPADALDVVSWSSSDVNVASVSPSGEVTAHAVGTAVITAKTRSGQMAECQVTVEEATSLFLRLYLMETINWGTLESSELMEITEEGGTYTCTLELSKDEISSIGSLYFKDIAVYSETASTSVFSAVAITLDSVKVNGTECNILAGEKEAAITSGGVLDYCLINCWDVASAKIEGFEVIENYYYPDAQDQNVIEITFTVSDVTR